MSKQFAAAVDSELSTMANFTLVIECVQFSQNFKS